MNTGKGPIHVAGYGFDNITEHLAVVLDPVDGQVSSKLNIPHGVKGRTELPDAAMAAIYYEKVGAVTLASDWKPFHYENRNDGSQWWFMVAGIDNLARHVVAEHRFAVVKHSDAILNSFVTNKYESDLTYAVPMAKRFFKNWQWRYSPFPDPHLRGNPR